MPSVVNRVDLKFLLNDWLALDRLLELPHFAGHSVEDVEAMLDLVTRIAEDVVAPSLRAGDASEPTIDADQRVRVQQDVRKAVLAIRDTGLFGTVFPAEQGGLQLPFLVYIAAMGILHSASSAATFCMMLTVGNARLLAAHAGPALFAVLGRPQVAGEWFGTMCLSEPQAGSSLGDITTSAVANGRDELGEHYRITGSKMWISGGDQDVSDNIVHLVLAKTPDENGKMPEGSRGIALFAVPRILPDGQTNDVVAAGLNHKLGSRGLPNCVLNFGEGFAHPDGAAGAIGWRVGKQGEGLALMFQMMNEARVSVGMAATMTAYRGYLISLNYARERKQGRLAGQSSGAQVAIVQHVDVRRMLLSQKACCEGALALCLYAARLQDVENEGQTPEERAEAASLMALLTPIVKSWPSEFGQVSLHHALQVLGGAGYTRDFEVEQLYRDNRLNPIHEGTTGIQALDLVGRKLRKDRGKSYRLLRARVDASHAAAAPFEALSQAGAALAVVWQEIDAAVEQVLADAEGESLDHATALLSAMGHAVIGWIWLDLATLAAVRMATGGECYVDGYLLGKIKACDYFAQFELPLVAAWLAPLRSKVTMVRDFGIAEFLGEAE